MILVFFAAAADAHFTKCDIDKIATAKTIFVGGKNTKKWFLIYFY